MIVFPMAGLSSRFLAAGYAKPKYELKIGGETVFEKAVSSFERYFKTDIFLFITRKDLGAKVFIQEKLRKMSVDNYRVVELEEETLGQADTVYQGLKGELDQELFIFNIDTFLLAFQKPSWLSTCDGYLEVFKGEGEHWSFIESSENNCVLRTTEKERISDCCSNGLYYFKSSVKFCSLVERCIKLNQLAKGELYIAPLYNDLIKENYVIKYVHTDVGSIDFCGTPDEYIELKRKYEA